MPCLERQPTADTTRVPALPFSDFQRLAGAVRTDLQLDYVEGFTPVGVASEQHDGVHAGLLGEDAPRIRLTSTFGLRNLAPATNRPFDRVVRKHLEASIDAIRAGCYA